MDLVAIVGTRPNFVKLAALVHGCREKDIDIKIVHTGQHFDEEMSGGFFRDLDIPKPDVNLGISGGLFDDQIGRLIPKINEVLADMPERWVVVIGDSLPVAAGAIVGKARGMTVAHVEAGLRSGNWEMPEEINRTIADSLSDVWLASEPSGVENLRKEGKRDRVYLVGNVMVDTLVANLEKIKKQTGVGERQKYVLCTFHRIENVNKPEIFAKFINTINMTAKKYLPVVFPVHPRTAKKISESGVKFHPRVQMITPLEYLEMQKAQSDAAFVMTDSGGVQDETTWWGVPCLTLREETERPVTVTVGTNTLVGSDEKLTEEKIREVLEGKYKKGEVPKYWDGKAAGRVIEKLKMTESKYRFMKNRLV